MLVRLMLRTALVEALKGKTLVGNRVFDSSLTALSFGPNGQVVAEDGDGPFIAVYTGDGQLKDEGGHGQALRLGGSVCEVLIQFGISEKMTETHAETDASVLIGFSFPPIDEALQMHLDIVGREILNELVSPTSDWGLFAQRLMVRTQDASIEAALSHGEGHKLAAYQLRLLAHMVSEPKDMQAGSIGEAYLGLLSATPNPPAFLQKQQTILSDLLGGEAGDVETARRELGQAVLNWRRLGLGHLGGPDDTLTTAMVEVGDFNSVNVQAD